MTTRTELELTSLEQFDRNKPHDDDLFGYGKGIAPSEHKAAHLLLLNEAWHKMRADRFERDLMKDINGGEVIDGEAERLTQIIAQMRCVHALVGLIKTGPVLNTLPITSYRADLDLNEFLQERPYFYVTAQAADQEGKDPRYVAKLEKLIPRSYAFDSKGLQVDVEVSDLDDNKGAFPTHTKNWQLAHLMTSSMMNITYDFPYLADAYHAY